MSVTFPVDYIMDVKLEANLGSDIPLYDRQFYNERCPEEVPSLKRVNGTTFNFEQEDYWLFCVHLNKAEMEFAIGGENPAYATSHPNWRNLSTNKDRELVLHSHEVGIANAPCRTWCDFKLDFDRYVGIRCPKMTNPAITIKANGNHGEVKWVGLFVKSSVEDKNEFIAVKTTNRLLPAYGKRNESYEWYSPDRGVDVTNDRCIMLWPKQLYGTKGNRQDTYKQFVTVDPNSPLAARHITRVKERVKNRTALDITAQGRSYTWNVNSITEIWGIHTKPRGGGRGRSVFNYSAGTKVTHDDMEGVKILLRVFGTVTKMATGMVKGDFASVLESIVALPQQFNNSSVDPDAKGFITALAALGQHQWNNRPRQPGSKEKTINTAGVELLSMKQHPFDSDFGCD